ncbi:hypothetical protein N665_0567s0015 [Sinapis alba]|nr:hypothetical protein N665_0567s0015 [Sinapis alba]
MASSLSALPLADRKLRKKVFSFRSESKIRCKRETRKSSAVKEDYPVAEETEQDALAPVIRNKLKGNLKAAAIKAPSFGERKSHCLDDLAYLNWRDEMGLSLEKAGKEVLGTVKRIVVTKGSTMVVVPSSTNSTEVVVPSFTSFTEMVVLSFTSFTKIVVLSSTSSTEVVVPIITSSTEVVVPNITNFTEIVIPSFKKILNERIARLSSGIALINPGGQTQVELKDKQLAKEGIVVGGGCALLRLAAKVDSIKATLDNTEQKIGAEIFKKALSYPMRLIAKNAGANGNVVLSNENMMYGYNAAKNQYEDLMSTIRPRYCLEHATLVAKTLLTSDAVVVEIKENKPRPMINPPLPTSPAMFPDRNLPQITSEW